MGEPEAGKEGQVLVLDHRVCETVDGGSPFTCVCLFVR